MAIAGYDALEGVEASEDGIEVIREIVGEPGDVMTLGCLECVPREAGMSRLTLRLLVAVGPSCDVLAGDLVLIAGACVVLSDCNELWEASFTGEAGR